MVAWEKIIAGRWVNRETIWVNVNIKITLLRKCKDSIPLLLDIFAKRQRWNGFEMIIKNNVILRRYFSS